MEISADLEKKIKELIKKGDVAKAVTMVNEQLKLGLKASKDIVDKYRKNNHA